MKSNYIKPIIIVEKSQLRTVLMQSLSDAKTKTSAWDVQGLENSTLGVDNEATSIIGMESNQRGGFGTDAGPWESLW